MREKLTVSNQIGFLIGLLALLALACNAPLDGNETPSPLPPTNPAVQSPAATTPDQSPTAELSPTSDTKPTADPSTTSAATETATSLPTFTPIQATQPANATATATPTPTKAATSAPTATPTTNVNGGPLGFTYSISWEVVSGNPNLAVATVSISATGGGGGYQYFRDDLPVEGPIFQYEWATCRANPGSLRVTSADGQSLKVDYYEQPPCPSP